MSTIMTHRSHLVGATALTTLSLMLVSGCASDDGNANVTALTVPGLNAAAACAELSPETMSNAEMAFRGTVTAIDGDQVTLRVDEKYQGEIENQVTVPQQIDDMPSELSIGAFIEGDEYLISAVNGGIITCGQSGPATPELSALYTAAF